MKAEAKKSKLSIKKIIVIVALAVFILYILVSVITINIDIKQRKEELAELNQELENQQILNAELSDMIDSGEVEDYLIRIAREKYGYVFPDEEVFVDISGK
jgi:cell division protein FtsB